MERDYQADFERLLALLDRCRLPPATAQIIPFPAGRRRAHVRTPAAASPQPRQPRGSGGSGADAADEWE
jgi:hypothetical protein